jgi:hypothetical protein
VKSAIAPIARKINTATSAPIRSMWVSFDSVSVLRRVRQSGRCRGCALFEEFRALPNCKENATAGPTEESHWFEERN